MESEMIVDLIQVWKAPLLICFYMFFVAMCIPLLIRAVMIIREIMGEGGTAEIKPEPPEKITKNSKGYYVRLETGERVFVSYAELYPDDPDLQHTIVQPGKYVWDSVNQKWKEK